MEFKVAEREKDLETKAREALEQIEERTYLAEFAAQGIETVWRYGVAFCGKKVKLAAGFNNKKAPAPWQVPKISK